MADFINYDNDTFKCIDRIPEYSDYHSIYVAKRPHTDETGRDFQVINACWGVEKILHPIYHARKDNGYLQLNLPSIDGKKNRRAYVHRLVLLTWSDVIPENYPTLQTNHKDQNRTNNSFDNLELVTPRENINYGDHNRRMVYTRAENGNTTKVMAINIFTEQPRYFKSTRECAQVIGTCNSSIYHCMIGKPGNHSLKGYVFCKPEDYTEVHAKELIAKAHPRKATKERMTIID